MGRAARVKPKRLADKLRYIRTALGLSQSELLSRLGVTDLIDYTKISAYEREEREPPLPILLEYARLANVWMDVLVDDELDLPESIPAPTKSEGVKLKPPPARRRPGP
jgi:transcriptional regulator with XRE-family HTH domain